MNVPDAATLAALGFRPDDAADAMALVEGLDADGWDQVEALAAELRLRVGSFATDPPELPDGPLEAGEAYLLAFLATAEDVLAAYRRRGVPEEVARRSLSDLGQQVFVHRQTYGRFGLHTQAWIAGSSWLANLYWLGRLQFEYRRIEDRWWLSVHIPQTGSLDPAAVDHAFGQAQTFADTYWLERPVVGFHCDSWLLDPQLAQAVPGSNLAAFQARWTLFGEAREADADVLFFVFHRRGEVDLDTLPQRSRLERAVVAILQAGGHWHGRQGTCGRLDP